MKWEIEKDERDKKLILKTCVKESSLQDTEKEKIIVDHKRKMLTKNSVEMKLVVGLSKFHKSFAVNHEHLLQFKKETSKQCMP